MGNRPHLCCVNVGSPVCVLWCVFIVFGVVWCAIILFVGVYGSFVVVIMVRLCEIVG